MGYRKKSTVHTLEFKQYEGLVVRMKGLKIGKMRRVLRALGDDNKDTGALVDEMATFVVEGLVSWNLEDENGTPLPADREQVEDLEFDMLTEILSTWLERLTGPDDDLGKGSSSGEKFPGRPLTMEAL